MKMLRAQVDWHGLQPLNPPELVVFVDEFPELNNLKFKRKGDILYATNKNSILTFYYYPGPGVGNNARTINITLQNNSSMELIGPWSSRTGVINTLDIGQYVDITLVRQSDRKRMTVAVSYRRAEHAAKLADVTLAKVVIDSNTGEHIFIPYSDIMPPKQMDIIV